MRGGAGEREGGWEGGWEGEQDKERRRDRERDQAHARVCMCVCDCVRYMERERKREKRGGVVREGWGRHSREEEMRKIASMRAKYVYVCVCVCVYVCMFEYVCIMDQRICACVAWICWCLLVDMHVNTTNRREEVPALEVIYV